MASVTKEEIYKMFEKITKQNDSLAKQVESLGEELRSYKITVQNKIEDLENQNEDLKLENTKLKERLLSCERRSKKYNLVIYNLPGENIYESIVNLFNHKLDIDCKEDNIRDAYRLSSKQNNQKHSPIFIECFNSKFKALILSRAKNLKGTGIFIAPDYAAEDYQKKKCLFQYQKIARQQGQTATIKGNSLIIDGVPRSIEEIQVKDLVNSLHIDNPIELHRSSSVSSIASSTSKNKRSREEEEETKYPKKNLRSHNNK